MIRVAGLLAAAYVVVTIVAAIGVYGLGWSGSKTQTLTTYVPLPAARVGGHMIWFHRYLDSKLVIQHQNEQIKKSTGSFPVPDPAEYGPSSLTKLIRESMTQRELQRLDITVSAADIDQAYSAQLLAFGSADQIAQVIRELYDWTPEQFKEDVVKSSVQREKLREYLSFNEKLNATSRQQAEKVFGLVQADKEKFAELSKTYSEDAYAEKSGDEGFFASGTHPKEFDDAAFALQPNEISEIIHTKYGFHIIKLMEKKNENGQDLARIQQIFISAPSVDRYITQQLKDTGVTIYVKGLGWDNQQGRVIRK